MLSAMPTRIGLVPILIVQRIKISAMTRPAPIEINSPSHEDCVQ